MFLDRVERLPVTSRSHVTDITDITDVTDKCKISIMIQVHDIVVIAHRTACACVCGGGIPGKVPIITHS